MPMSEAESQELEFENQERWTHLGLLEKKVTSNTSAAGHDLHPADVLFPKNDKIAVKRTTSWSLITSKRIPSISSKLKQMRC